MGGHFVFDRTEPGALSEAIRSLFVYRATDWAALAQYHSDMLPYLLIVPPAVLFSFPVLKKPIAQLNETAWGVAVLNLLSVVLLAACVAALISESFNPFIYFRF